MTTIRSKVLEEVVIGKKLEIVTRIGAMHKTLNDVLIFMMLENKNKGPDKKYAGEVTEITPKYIELNIENTKNRFYWGTIDSYKII